MNNLLAKLGIAGTTSVIVTEAVNPAPLLNALITLGVSIVTVLSVEGVAWLKNFIIRHTKKGGDNDETKSEDETQK